MHRFPSTSACNPSVRTATTDMRHTPARPWGITGRAISTTASFSAWGHGPAGDMGTAGEAIASSTMVEDGITAELAVYPPAQAAGRHFTAPRPVRPMKMPMLAGRDLLQIMPHRMRRLRAPRLREVAGEKPAAAVRTATALTSNLSMQHQAAEHTGSAALHLGSATANAQLFQSLGSVAGTKQN